MNIERKSIGLVGQAPEAKNLEAARAALKNLAWQQIDLISEEQATVLVKDIRALERFLGSAEHPKEKVFLSTKRSIIDNKSSYQLAYDRSRDPRLTKIDKKYFTGELKFVVGGIINTMHPERLQEVVNSPRDFINLLHGRPYEVPTVRERSPAAVKRTEAEPVSAPAEVKELEDPEAQLNRAIEIKDEKMKKIIIVARDLWPDFPFDSFPSIKSLFKASGVEVEVEFFKPDNQNYGMDYIIVYYKDDSKQKGIIVPRSGTILNMTSMFELFPGKKADVEVMEPNLLEFPEVEKKDIYPNGLQWKVTKYGKLRKEIYQ